MTNFITFDIDGVEPEFGAPEPGRIIAGDPHFRTW
ncbi:cupin, partial [Rhizobium leguminosarum]|nr:cupin [Rhizobium leguminosarum]